MSDASNVLSQIPGELLARSRNGLPQAQPDSPDTQRAIIRLPDGRRAEVTYLSLKSRKGKSVRWFWTPDRAVILAGHETVESMPPQKLRSHRSHSRAVRLVYNIFDPPAPRKSACKWVAPFGSLPNASCPKHHSN